MHLFVGNISKNVKISDLEAEFEQFGKCKINVPKVPCLSPPYAWKAHLFLSMI